MSCSFSYLMLPATLNLMGRAYLVLLETAHTENRKWSDFIPVACFSLRKLYFPSNVDCQKMNKSYLNKFQIEVWRGGTLGNFYIYQSI